MPGEFGVQLGVAGVDQQWAADAEQLLQTVENCALSFDAIVREMQRAEADTPHVRTAETIAAVWLDLREPAADEEKRVEEFLAVDVPTREEMREIETSNRLYEEAGALLTTAVLFSYLFCVFLYFYGLASKRPERRTGHPVYDFFMGTSLNPRVGDFDIKLFLEARVSLIGWLLLDLSLAHVGTGELVVHRFEVRPRRPAWSRVRVLLSAGQLLLDRSGMAADPYLTLVGYFNATRELAGMTRYMGDDVQNRIKRPRKDSGFPPRHGAAFGLLNTGELTARIASSEIGRTLDRLGLEFDPDYDTTEAFQARMAAQREGKKVPTRKEAPFDVVLATSMLQVGVDVQRLGLMLVVGQPKNTAEYIQASSRVGRDPSARPGLVVSLGNWARPRDLAHFEQFKHYHETFYAHVEALSVTPYSPTSLERGIDGLLVSAARVLQASVTDGLSPEREAWRIRDERTAVEAIAEKLKKRIAAAALDEAATKRANDLLVNRLDRWAERAKRAADMHKTLVYERTGEGGKYLPLIISPENAKASVGGSMEAPFVIANSMREVQPEINLLVSPVPDRLFARAPDGVAEWTLPVGGED
mgnify:CR=1 FL=1